MKKITPFILYFTLIFFTAPAQKIPNQYQYKIDLANTPNDQFIVDLIAPHIQGKEAVFNIPKTVPGTYADNNFGYFVKDLKAYDKNGSLLPVEHFNTNRWKIKNVSRLFRLSYKVDDTFDDSTRMEKVFEPAGSSIEADTAYVINPFTVLGYFTGLEELPYQLQINHSPEFYGSTAMKDYDDSRSVDLFKTSNYHEVADNPILYTRPDTATISVGGAEILVSVYSPNKVINAAFLASQLESLAYAQTKYLGGKLPVKKYAYLVYLSDHPSLSHFFGALEHPYSSMYSMLEASPELFAQRFKDVAAHEFFHIITPLSIHSEEIQFFDFNAPKMSEHLWLYEGSTEYHAHKAQQEAGLTSVAHFLEVMGAKITNSRTLYNDTMSFTLMSKRILEPTYAKEYGNVYQKGTLINMCLDISLRKLSGGKYGLKNLLKDLSSKLGKGKPFKDEKLFDLIGILTYPQIKAFLEKYVDGITPLPLQDIFNSVGIMWLKDTTVMAFSPGGFTVKANKDKGRLFIANTDKLDAFGQRMHYMLGDTIVSINGKEITAVNYTRVVNELKENSKEGNHLVVEVLRKTGDAPQLIKLESDIHFVSQKKFNVLTFSSDASARQIALRNSWLYPLNNFGIF